ncbi:MAG: hypothetical protein ACOC45_04480 [Alkalispirochaetaceae bacterium]
MFSRAGDPDEETRKFWEKVEAELGQPVLEHALGQYVGGEETRGRPVWGLLYLTRDTLYYRHFATSNWFAAMIGGTPREDNDAFEIAVPFSQVTRVEDEGPLSLRQRFFRPYPEVTTIHYTARGEDRELRISLEHRGDAFRRKLHELVE